VGVEYNQVNDTITTNLQSILNRYATILSIQNAYKTPSATDTIRVDGRQVTISSLA
jgi:hypothetical protein